MSSPRITPAVAVVLLAAAAWLAGPARAADSLADKYPKASAAFELIEKAPLLKQALLEDDFFARLDRDASARRNTQQQLFQAAYRQIGPVAPISTRVYAGTTSDGPEIVLEYQTRFQYHYDRHILRALTDDPSAAAEYEALEAKRRPLPDDQRIQLVPQYQALFARYAPKMDLPEVRREVQGILDTLLEAFKPYGAEVLTSPAGHYGVKITDRLYLTLRDFPLQTHERSTTNLRYPHDPFFWLVLSSGPKELPSGYLPAFPGAEGMGAMATGGRGGKVIYVTTLDAEGPGSLIEALETAGPRIILFAVSGRITLPRDIWITHGDLTMIGYTAPGEGMEINGRLCLAASNVILRGMRFRLYPPMQADGMDTRGTQHDVIFDHCSFAYGSDELLRFVGVAGPTIYGYTIQYCLLGPGMAGLRDHPFGPETGGYGSIHHNILYNTTSRSPEVDCLLIDWRNNVLYNCRSGHCRRPWAKFNEIGNYIIENPATPYRYSFSVTDNVWSADNLREEGGQVRPFEPGRGDEEGPESAPAVAPAKGYLAGPYRVMPVTTHKAEELEGMLTAIAGAYLPARDATDKFYIEGLKTRTGKIPWWDSNPEGVWIRRTPSYPEGRLIPWEEDTYVKWSAKDFPPPVAGAKAPADSDGDGMPDEWETARGLNANDASDGPADADGDGYTNVEEYLYRTDPHQAVDYKDPKNNVHTLH